MKKFLSILLALAVGFTFTFGSAMSAFATVGNPSTANLEVATKYFDDAVDAALSNAKVNPNYANFSSAAVTYATSQAKSAETIILAELVDQYDLDTTGGMTAFKAEVLKWTQDNTPEKIGAGKLAAYKTSFDAYYVDQVSTVDYAEQVKAAVAQIAAIDTTVYSTSKHTVSGIDYTYKTYAEKLIKEATDVLNGYQNTDSSAATTYVVWGTNGATLKTAIDTLLYGKANGSATDFEKSGTNLYYSLSQLLTVAQEDELNSGAAVDKNYAKSDLAYNYKTTKYTDIKAVADEAAATVVGRLGTVGADIESGVTKIGGVMVYDTANKIVMGVSIADMTKLTAAEAAAVNAAITKMLDNTIEVTDVYFDELKVTALGASGTVANSLTALKAAALIDVIKAADTARSTYADKEALAATMKGQYTYSGVKMFDNDDVDKALAKDKADIYAGHIKVVAESVAYTPKNYLRDVTPINDPTAKAIGDAKDKFAITITTTGANKTADADKVYCANYYDGIYYAEWADIATDAIEALDEAANVDEVNSIMADAAAKLAKLRTAETAQAIAAAKWSSATYQSNLNTYAANIVKNPAVKEATYDAIVAKYIGTNAAVPTASITYTDATLNYCYNTADYAAAKAAMDNAGSMDLANTEDELKTLYNEAIAALANPITKAELEAKAKEVAAAIAALPSAATVANEDAFMAAHDAYEAYLDLDGAAKADIAGYLVFESKMTTLKTAQQKAVTDAIAALPATVTTADKAAIEAARALADKYTEYYDQYDESFTISNIGTLETKETALSTAQKNAVIAAINALTENSTAEEIKAARDAYDALTPSQKRAIGSAYEYKLLNAEAAKKFTADDAKAYVQDLAIAVRTAKVGKKVKVTVNADVQKLVDNGFTVEYKFYKSTKKSSGYKNTVNKTANTYTNTNPVKGKNYYKVKLVVKDADGAVVATTPLTQCKYGVRTIK